MSKDKEDIIRKAKGMMSKTMENGCSEAEAVLAAEMLAKLLRDSELSSEDISTHIGQKDISDEEFVTDGFTAPLWMKNLLDNIAQAYQCHGMWRRGWSGFGSFKGRNLTAHFIGEESDARIAAYFFEVLYNSLGKMARKEGRELGLTGHSLSRFRTNYVCAASMEIRLRLVKRRRIEAQADQNLFALIKSKENAISKYMKDNHSDIKSVGVAGSNGFLGYEEGSSAGKSIGLADGVGVSARQGQKKIT